MDHVAAIVNAYGYPAVFALLLMGIVGLPVPDEWLLLFTGYLVFKGYFHIVPALVAAVLGSICGISVSYFLGSALGSRFVRRYGHRFRVTEDRMQRVHAWFDRTGRWSLLVGYFVPGFRHLAGFVAGTSRLRFRDFALFAYLGAFLWSVNFVAIGYYFGAEWAITDRAVHRNIVTGVVLAAILVLLYTFFRKGSSRK